MGRLGQAINLFFNGKRQKLHIVAAFDVDPTKVGTTIDNTPCYHINTLTEVVEQKKISIAILTSPMHVAPELVEPIVEAGIKGVVNFTTVPLNFPEHVISENDDVTAVVEKVAYFVKELNK
jgi:redox-sensing transcriptional repressor